MTIIPDLIANRLRLALRLGRIAQGELMSRHKLFAQGLKSANILNLMIGIEHHTGSNDTLAFRITFAKWMPEIAVARRLVSTSGL